MRSGWRRRPAAPRLRFEHSVVRLEAGARERIELQGTAAKDREASVVAHAEAASCQAQAARARTDAEAARAREAAALDRARAAEERAGQVSQGAAAASERAKAAASEAQAWRTAARKWALRAHVQRTTSAQAAARRRGFERWRLRTLTTALALARSAAAGAAAAASSAKRARLVGASLRKMARVEVWRAWALWRRAGAVSSAAEAMQAGGARS